MPSLQSLPISPVPRSTTEKFFVNLFLSVNIKSLTRFLVICVFVLLVLSLTVKTAFLEHKFVVGLFDLDKEMNVPTFFSSMTLMASSLLFFIVARIKKRESDKFSLNWLVLSIIFLLLSADEFMALHEQTSQFFRGTKIGNFIHFGWVILAAIFLLFFLLSYIKFFFHLSNRFKKLFLLSAVIYIWGAVGMELVGGIYATHFGQHNLGYFILTNIEETFEMSGVVLLIYSLLHYIKEISTLKIISEY